MGMIGNGFVDLADVAFDDAAFDGHGPHGDEAKVGGAPGDGQRNYPAVGRSFSANDAKRLGDEDAESFARIVAEPAGVEVVVEAKLQIAFGAFGDDGDVGMEVVKRLAFASKRHSTIPDDDSHERKEDRVSREVKSRAEARPLQIRGGQGWRNLSAMASVSGRYEL